MPSRSAGDIEQSHAVRLTVRSDPFDQLLGFGGIVLERIDPVVVLCHFRVHEASFPWDLHGSPSLLALSTERVRVYAWQTAKEGGKKVKRQDLTPEMIDGNPSR